jgi:hypothetical protein
MLSSLPLLALALCAADDGLARALQGVTGASSYSFTVTEGMGAPAGVVEGKYQKGQPLYFKADRIEFFKLGDAMAYKHGGAWQKSRRGTLSDPLIILGGAAKVRAARLPHEELAGFEKYFKAVKKSQEKGETVYAGELTGEAVAKLVKTELRGVARSGTARVWVDAKGRLVKYQVAIKVQGRLGNAEIDGETTKTVTLSDVGATKVEVPMEAKKALE